MVAISFLFVGAPTLWGLPALRAADAPYCWTVGVLFCMQARYYLGGGVGVCTLHLKVIAAQDHGHCVQPNLVCVRVAGRLGQHHGIHTGLKHQLVCQDLPAVALVIDSDRVFVP